MGHGSTFAQYATEVWIAMTMGNNPTIEGYGDGASLYGIANDPNSLRDKTDSKDEGGGYEAGADYDYTFDVPEYVQLLRDELNEVRAALSKVNEQEMARMMGDSGATDPIERIREDQARDALYKEEDRLQLAIQDAQWILPPLMEPPHNMPTQEKAKTMLHEGSVRGKPLTKGQRGLFGIIASGKRPKIAPKKGY
jgi:hypothetical protein